MKRFDVWFIVVIVISIGLCGVVIWQHLGMVKFRAQSAAGRAELQRELYDPLSAVDSFPIVRHLFMELAMDRFGMPDTTILVADTVCWIDVEHDPLRHKARQLLEDYRYQDNKKRWSLDDWDTWENDSTGS